VIAALLLFPILVRYDARRPASWLMLVAAAVAAWAVGAADGPAGDSVAARLATTVFAAGLLAVGGVGDLPRTVFRGFGIGAEGTFVWALERIAWPVCGWWLGSLAAGTFWLAGVVTLVAGAAAVTNAMLVVRGGQAADAASVTLAAAGVAAAAGLVAGGPGNAGLFIAAAAAGWAAVAAVGFGVERPGRPLGAIRTLLNAAAMAAALGGMVGWLFLDPAAARHAVTLSLASFVTLAVPEATLGDGVSWRQGWRRLHRSAADTRPLRLLAPLGRYGDAVTTTAGTAAILGWPPLVALVLSPSGSEAGPSAALAVAGLVAAAGLLVGLVGCGERLWRADEARASTETILAVAIAVTLAAIVVVPAASRLPSLPVLPRSTVE